MFRKILHRIGFSNFCRTLKLLRFRFSAAVAFVSDIYFKCPGSFEGLGNELPYFELVVSLWHLFKTPLWSYTPCPVHGPTHVCWCLRVDAEVTLDGPSAFCPWGSTNIMWYCWFIVARSWDLMSCSVPILWYDRRELRIRSINQFL